MGPAHKGQESSKAKTLAEVRAKSAEIVRGLTAKQYYYEQWKVREGLLSGSFKRYKYYVLASYPESEYKRLVASFSQK